MASQFSIFSDPILNEKFSKDGFMVVDLLDAATVNELIEYYHAHDMIPGEGEFYATMFHPDPEMKRTIGMKVRSTIHEQVGKYITGFEPLLGNFIAKAGNTTHEVGIHQDWTYVDESKYRSFNVWTPLCKTNELNGGMFMLKGSHQVDMPLRFTPFDSTIYDRYKSEIINRSEMCELSAGQAVIYDSAVIHFSSLNRTDEMRLACGCVFTPSEAMSLHYFKEDDDILVYRAGPDFF